MVNMMQDSSSAGVSVEGNSSALLQKYRENVENKFKDFVLDYLERGHQTGIFNVQEVEKVSAVVNQTLEFFCEAAQREQILHKASEGHRLKVMKQEADLLIEIAKKKIELQAAIEDLKQKRRIRKNEIFQTALLTMGQVTKNTGLQSSVVYPLHLAAKLGNSQAVDILLLQGFDKNQLDDEKNTPFICALSAGKLKVANLLKPEEVNGEKRKLYFNAAFRSDNMEVVDWIMKWLDIDLNQDLWPLEEAIQADKVVSIRHLLNKIHSEDMARRASLWYLAKLSIFYQSKEALAFFLNKLIDEDFTGAFREAFYFLWEAIELDEITVVEEFLKKSKKCPQMHKEILEGIHLESGKNLLHLLAELRKEKILNLIMKEMKDLDIFGNQMAVQNKDGRTPLETAIKKENLYAIDLFLHLDLCSADQKMSWLEFAYSEGSLQVLHHLAESMQANDINQCIKRMALLFRKCIFKEELEIAKFLLIKVQIGAESHREKILQQTDHTQGNLLHIGANSSDPKVVCWLLDQLKPDKDFLLRALEAKNEAGFTPYDIALRSIQNDSREISQNLRQMQDALMSSNWCTIS